jgi:hypothetical protein
VASAGRTHHATCVRDARDTVTIKLLSMARALALPLLTRCCWRREQRADNLLHIGRDLADCLDNTSARTAMPFGAQDSLGFFARSHVSS